MGLGQMSTLDTRPGLRELSAEMFSPRVGEVFIFRRPAHPDSASKDYVELKLVDVKAFSALQAGTHSSENSGIAPERAAFSMLFELSEGISPPGAGLHRIEHPEFQPEEWYIARVKVFGRDPKKAYYEAVFA